MILQDRGPCPLLEGSEGARPFHQELAGALAQPSYHPQPWLQPAPSISEQVVGKPFNVPILDFYFIVFNFTDVRIGGFSREALPCFVHR